MANFYRGLDTLIHVETLTNDMIRRLRAVRAEDGPLVVLQTPGTVAYDGPGPRIAHPLLVYSELMTANDPRMREAGADLRQRFMDD